VLEARRRPEPAALAAVDRAAVAADLAREAERLG